MPSGIRFRAPGLIVTGMYLSLLVNHNLLSQAARKPVILKIHAGGIDDEFFGGVQISHSDKLQKNTQAYNYFIIFHYKHVVPMGLQGLLWIIFFYKHVAPLGQMVFDYVFLLFYKYVASPKQLYFW